MTNFERIKQAVMQNCGGFENATNEQILDKWRSLPTDLQTQYFNSVKETKNQPKVKNADN